MSWHRVPVAGQFDGASVVSPDLKFEISYDTHPTN